jgi:hypothetical protein
VTSRMIFVIAGAMDANISVNREIALVNFLMTAFPGHVFLCRGSFLLIELFHPRSPSEWADQYLRIVDHCDAIYCHEGNRDHPIVDYATDLELAILEDHMDLELYLSAPLVDS